MCRCICCKLIVLCPIIDTDFQLSLQTEAAIFPANTGGASKMAMDLGVPFLGSLPLDPRLARSCDEGTNFLIDIPDSPIVLAFNKLLKGE